MLHVDVEPTGYLDPEPTTSSPPMHVERLSFVAIRRLPD